MTQRRRFPTKTTDPTPSDGESVFDKIQEYAAWVLRNCPAVLTLDTGTGGSTANALVATSETTITSYQAGQRHALYPVEPNTGAVTIEIDGLASRAVVDSEGNALTGSEFTAGLLVDLLDDGTSLRIVNSSNAQGAGSIDVQTFTANGTWSKPSGNFKWAEVYLIGGGGAGCCRQNGIARGGYGGSALLAKIPFSSLGNSESVVIGAGGSETATDSDGGDGGDSQFGSFMTCPGGDGGKLAYAAGTLIDPGSSGFSPSVSAGVYVVSAEPQGRSPTTNGETLDSGISGPHGSSASFSAGTASNLSYPAVNGLGANGGGYISSGGTNYFNPSGYGSGGAAVPNAGAANAARQGLAGFCRVVCY